MQKKLLLILSCAAGLSACGQLGGNPDFDTYERSNPFPGIVTTGSPAQKTTVVKKAAPAQKTQVTKTSSPATTTSPKTLKEASPEKEERLF